MSTRDYTDSDSDDAPSPSPTSRAISPSSPTKDPVRLKLRPGIYDSAEPSPSVSASPPPRFKIKLGMKHPRQAAYSSSDEEKPSKKQKTKVRSPPPPAAVPKKKYDWLTPSAAGASHHGPEGRNERAPSALSAISPASTPAEDTAAEKKKGGRRSSGQPGPGKAWRKGMRKGDPMPWKEGSSFMGDKVRSSPLATPQRHSVSREVSPDLDSLLLASVARERERVEREPSPPFVLADPVKLGIPVFANPIVSPKISLSQFPKVTQTFARMDLKPWPKEEVRRWSYDERVIRGVGGGNLKFKTWSRGPDSQLSAVLASQREAEAAARAAKREMKQKESETPDRPSFPHSLSGDSVPRAMSVDEESEADGDDSARESPAPRRRKPAKPRKSKLAQEIKPEADSSVPPE
ncbi:hypothetical protein CC85DRAFT_143065 [Cutaneotrichosporon oleaginosum]|uniref:Uncharacterized protein n=1 Tax=Cutaneotrichosporon oleaginosum TaxID=879819 RepID=A0A0J0XI62_9TREE|nr:uncharacterized protein CC85DRAFT_143065 [Cutaneotrichosporon oleaginosum]KLT40768.1 hypothetical protein CC85DRAFT_143065 [Cutaneotrichosporon oleaginosum]TXT06776.1 hypothetical protein COLE_06107 [Cutaneotrichosporon oleaginosum]